ncbi:MAG: hypothetical protein NXI32_04815 [bacterium]|nr:hypothetical protein [bacterium]
MELNKLTLNRYSGSGKSNSIGLKANAAARTVDEPALMFMSVAGPANLVKAAKAMVQSGKDFDVVADEIGRCGSYDGGYTVVVTRLPKYSTAHMIAVAKDPQLLLGDASEQLKRYILSDHITTPVLPEWMPHIEEKLRSLGMIQDMRTFGCKAAMAEFGSEELDAIVSTLVKTRKAIV